MHHVLEDRLIDEIAVKARRHETMIVAHRPRAWIDLNRAEWERDSQVEEEASAKVRPRSSAKLRAGLGLVPRRASGVQPIWNRRFSGAEIDARAVNTLPVGVDDDGNNVIDDYSEIGWVGSDDAPDDNATDILIIDGTGKDDVVLVSQTLPEVDQQPQVRIDYYEKGQAIKFMLVDLLDDDGNFTIEQIRLAGLAGDDVIGFVTAETVLPEWLISR